MTKNKFIPTKNYVYNACFILALILVVWYIASWYTIRKQERLMNSYLITTNTLTYKIDDIEKAGQSMQELPSEYFVYISHTNSEKIYKLEKKLKSIIDAYELSDELYYIDVTDDLDNDNLYTLINDAFNIDISNLPCIIYIRNGNIERIINEKDGIFKYQDFEKLLKDYEYEKKSL